MKPPESSDARQTARPAHILSTGLTGSSTTHGKHAIAKATLAIINLFDPRHVTENNPSGYAYEAYFFEARDAHGIPYLATFNHWRPPHVGVGQWAAQESLYAFDHG